MANNMDIGEAFDAVADTDLWIDVVSLLAGFAAAAVAQSAIENRANTDLPDEVYGMVVVGAAEVVPLGEYTREVQLGGAGHTGLNAVGRTNMGDSLPEV